MRANTLRSRIDRTRRLHGAALAVLIAIAFASVYAGAGGADNILPDPGWAVTAGSSTTNLVDGQVVTVNVKSRTDVAVNQVEIRECRFGVTYSTPADVLPDAGNCPSRPVSTSADYFVTRSASGGLAFLARTADGANIPFLVGEGVVDWSNASGNSSLTCDPTHPCALVVEISAGTETAFQTLKLDFADADPLAACGGAAAGALNTGGSDEISDAWAAWTRDECARTGSGAPTRASFTDERAAVTSFAQGDLDIAYTAAGYDAKVGLPSVPAASRRAAVAIPIALNASVIAAGGGQHQLVNGIPLGDKARYPDASLELTAAETGALLGGGQPWISRLDKPYGNDIVTRNPVLQGILYAPDAGVYAPSETLSSTWYMTSYLSSLAPSDFVRPTVAPPAPHGPTASLALSQPPFNEINLYTGRPSLQKVMFPEAISATDGPVWSMTDLASARALGITPVALESGGDFVAPTAAAMDAAVADMKPDAAGVLIPDPGAVARATPAAGATKPYPLTYVIYALVPAQPLVDQSTCALRLTSEQHLYEWLRYLTGAGQSNLPEGMEPLPAALAAQARADIAKVGATPVLLHCPVKGGGGSTTTTPTTVGPTTATTVLPASLSGGDQSIVPTGGVGLSYRQTGGRVTSIPTPPATVITVPPAGKSGGSGATQAVDASVSVPPFAGHRTAGALGGVIALVGIALITSLAAWITAGGVLAPAGYGGGSGAPRLSGGVDARRIASLALLWAAVGVTGVALVVFQLGPMLQQRDQRALLAHYRVVVAQAAAAADTPVGLSSGGAGSSTAAPELGTPVGIVEIGALKTQDVVVEGVQASDTRRGPGHVPGTAGLGQPGNSVIMARRNAYGGAFARIGALRAGATITVTTTQGQAVYVVKHVKHVTIAGSSDTGDGSSAVAAGSVRLTRVTDTSATSTDARKTTIGDVYGPTADDRLTLLTSGSRVPWTESDATEVVAELRGKPYPATPQGLRSTTETGLHGDGGALPSVGLALLAFVAVLAGSVLLYRRMRFRTAYVLTIAPLVALTVLTGETVVRLLPAWT